MKNLPSALPKNSCLPNFATVLSWTSVTQATLPAAVVSRLQTNCICKERDNKCFLPQCRKVSKFPCKTKTIKVIKCTAPIYVMLKSRTFQSS